EQRRGGAEEAQRQRREQGDGGEPADQRKHPQGELGISERVRCELLELEKTERRGLCVVERPSQTRGRTVQKVKREHRLVEPERAVSRVLHCPERETERDDD